MLRVLACSILLLRAASAQNPAAPSASLRFEVASIRPSNPDELAAGWSGISTARGQVTAIRSTLKEIIADAYGVFEGRVLAGPAWIESDRFQITAKADQPYGRDILIPMLRTLLAERFNLKLHHETRTGETLVLAVSKKGPKLQRVSGPPNSFSNGHGVLDATSISISQLAEVISHDLKLPIADRTGLKGAFKFTLRFDADVPAGDLRWAWSNALAQQLGLSLELRRMPVDVLVIDHVEKPSEN